MAKKTAVRRRDESVEFDDSAYENVRVSVTYDYNELTFARAAERLAPRGRQILTIANFVSLVVLVFCAWQLREQTVLLFCAAVVAFVVLYMWGNWNKLQLRYAKRTSLGLSGTSERRHVVVCDDAVHVQSSSGASATYSVSDLRTVSSTDEHLVAGFGSRRYVYVPRRATSEGRYRELVRFFEDHKR